MISKSTKKNRRKMAFANENRARLILNTVDAGVDFWLLGIKRSNSFVEWIEIYGKENAVKRLRRLSSHMGSRAYKSAIQPRY